MWARYVPLWNTLAKQCALWMATERPKKECFRNLVTAINYVWSLVTVVMTTFYGKLKFTHFCCCWYCYCCRRCHCRCRCCCLFCCPCPCRCRYHCHCHCYCYCYCSVSQQTLKNVTIGYSFNCLKCITFCIITSFAFPSRRIILLFGSDSGIRNFRQRFFLREY